MPKTKNPKTKTSPASEQIAILEKKLQAEKILDRRLYQIIAGLCVLFLGIVIGIGLQHYNVLGRLNQATRQIIGLENSLARTEAELALEAKKNQENVLLLAAATEENAALKEEATRKAAEEAQAELDAQAEAQASARRYVVATRQDSELPGLNTRQEPCGPAAGEYRVWGTGGEVLEGPVTPGPCLEGDYEWYKIKWNDNLEGWSIADYLVFSGERPLSTTGYLTGYTPFAYDPETDAPLTPTVCATSQTDNISYCNAELNPERSTYKLLVPAGDYVVSGTFRYRDYQTEEIVQRQTLFTNFMQCGYTPECFDAPDRDEAAVVTVGAGDAVVGISLYALEN